MTLSSTVTLEPENTTIMTTLHYLPPKYAKVQLFIVSLVIGAVTILIMITTVAIAALCVMKRKKNESMNFVLHLCILTSYNSNWWKNHKQSSIWTRLVLQLNLLCICPASIGNGFKYQHVIKGCTECIAQKQTDVHDKLPLILAI